MVRNVPANSIYLGSFEVLKKAAAEHKGVSVPELPAGYVLGAAGFGGILYWCAIYPVDVCKSAIMTVSPPRLNVDFDIYLHTPWLHGNTPCASREAPWFLTGTFLVYLPGIMSTTLLGAHSLLGNVRKECFDAKILSCM